MKEKIGEGRIPEIACTKSQPHHLLNTVDTHSDEQAQAQRLGIPLEVICNLGAYDNDCAGGCG